MRLLKLRLSMIGTLALIIGLSTLVFSMILSLLNAFNIFLLLAFVIGFNLIQWLFAPYLIDAMYRVKEVSQSEMPRLHEIVTRLSYKSGINKPKVMVADIEIPNAFAYGSPLTGPKIAVTRGLLTQLEEEEVEAVIGHEIGHLKHRDVQVMMFLSVLPAIFWWLGYIFLLSSWFRGYGNRGSGAVAVILGILFMILYWVFTLLILHFSRLREYYADAHSVSVVPDGARKLSEALAKIVHFTSRIKLHRPETTTKNSFKALFIADPDKAEEDLAQIRHAYGLTSDQKLVRDILRRKITLADRIAELFSTHPNIVKRLRALEALRK